MKKITELKSTFSSLLSNDFSSIASIGCYELGDVKLFLNGRFYNETPESFLNKYIQTGQDIFKTIDGDFTIIIINEGKVNIFRSCSYQISSNLPHLSAWHAGLLSSGLSRNPSSFCDV